MTFSCHDSAMCPHIRSPPLSAQLLTIYDSLTNLLPVCSDFFFSVSGSLGCRSSFEVRQLFYLSYLSTREQENGFIYQLTVSITFNGSSLVKTNFVKLNIFESTFFYGNKCFELGRSPNNLYCQKG